MDQLPYELRERVFKLVQLDDLATCRRVSRGFQQFVHEYLQTIQHVDVYKIDPWTDRGEKMPHYIHRLTGKDLCSIPVSIKKSKYPSTLFSFFSRYTPRLVSINAPQVTLQWTDLKKIAPRLIYFSLRELKVGKFKELNAKFIHEKFPQLMAFDLPLVRIHKFCPLEVYSMFSASPLSLFAQYSNHCYVHRLNCRPDPFTPSTQALVHAWQIFAPLPLFDFHQIKLFIWFNERDDAYLADICMPNLLIFELSCESVRTNDLAAFLSQSPKVESIDLFGHLLGDKQVLTLVIANLSHLKFLTIRRPLFSHFAPEINQEHENQPLTVPISDKLDQLSLVSNPGASILIQSVTTNNIRHLNMSGWPSVEFNFSFPKLVFFSLELKFSGRESIAWIIRCLQASPFLASFTFKSFHERAGQVESECVDEFRSLLENSRSLRFIDFSPGEAHNSFWSETLTINLNSLHCNLQAFRMVVHNRPIQIILPSRLRKRNLARFRAEKKCVFQMPQPGSRRGPSLFFLRGDMLHFSVAPGKHIHRVHEVLCPHIVCTTSD